VNRRNERDWDAPDYRGARPRGYQRSDARVFEDICDRLTVDPRIDASDIEVDVKGAEVTLRGSVRSREEKTLRRRRGGTRHGRARRQQPFEGNPFGSRDRTARSGASSTLALSIRRRHHLNRENKHSRAGVANPAPARVRIVQAAFRLPC
jgi:hypothetical protein